MPECQAGSHTSVVSTPQMSSASIAAARIPSVMMRSIGQPRVVSV